MTGLPTYRPDHHEFEFRKGPIFANIVLTDEINRPSPKRQWALLKQWAEKQTTVGGEIIGVPEVCSRSHPPKVPSRSEAQVVGATTGPHRRIRSWRASGRPDRTGPLTAWRRVNVGFGSSGGGSGPAFGYPY